jgi:hypothetical protein
MEKEVGRSELFYKISWQGFSEKVTLNKDLELVNE